MTSTAGQPAVVDLNGQYVGQSGLQHVIFAKAGMVWIADFVMS